MFDVWNSNIRRHGTCRLLDRISLVLFWFEFFPVILATKYFTYYVCVNLKMISTERQKCENMNTYTDNRKNHSLLWLLGVSAFAWIALGLINEQNSIPLVLSKCTLKAKNIVKSMQAESCIALNSIQCNFGCQYSSCDHIRFNICVYLWHWLSSYMQYTQITSEIMKPRIALNCIWC